MTITIREGSTGKRMVTQRTRVMTNLTVITSSVIMWQRIKRSTFGRSRRRGLCVRSRGGVMAQKLALITTGVLAVAGLLATTTVASAQPGFHSTQSSSDQVNPTPLLRTYPPQRGFDPLTASDRQLVAHGFPRRPTSPIALKAWKNAMARATNYVAPNPVYSSLRHGPS
jgi:hypothetical protein